MVSPINFQDDIQALEQAIRRAQDELDTLHGIQKAHDLKTRELRETLEGLSRILRGELPRPTAKAPGQSSTAHTAPASPRKRPARGSRSAQIEQACRELGTQFDSFTTGEVLERLHTVYGQEITDGIRSYTYALMNTLQKKGVVLKVDRGEWRLVQA